jgi:hypothetical protein
MSSIIVQSGGADELHCQTVIIVPEKAKDEAGYIKTLSTKDGAHAKHEFHALAQMAYFQYQDDELQIEESAAPCTINDGKEVVAMADGMALCRDDSGGLQVISLAGASPKKLLEAAYRYCTRWVRLDI